MNNCLEDLILNYLKELKKEKEDKFEKGDFSKIQSVKYGLSIDIQSLDNVIKMIEDEQNN